MLKGCSLAFKDLKNKRKLEKLYNGWINTYRIEFLSFVFYQGIHIYNFLRPRPTILQC